MATNHFRKLLDERDLREVDVAARIGVHRNTVNNWATGRTEIVPQRVQDLANLLGTSIDELAGIQPVVTQPPSGDAAAQASRDEAAESAIEVLRSLLDSAGALRSLNQAAPRLMDVLRDAEEAVERYGGGAPARGPRRTT